jgi:hypothetical protein
MRRGRARRREQSDEKGVVVPHRIIVLWVKRVEGECRIRARLLAYGCGCGRRVGVISRMGVGSLLRAPA